MPRRRRPSRACLQLSAVSVAAVLPQKHSVGDILRVHHSGRENKGNTREKAGNDRFQNSVVNRVSINVGYLHLEEAFMQQFTLHTFILWHTEY